MGVHRSTSLSMGINTEGSTQIPGYFVSSDGLNNIEIARNETVWNDVRWINKMAKCRTGDKRNNNDEGSRRNESHDCLC